MTAHIEEVDDGNFAKTVLGSSRPVLVDFWAQWCAPCRALAPTVEAVAERYAGNAQVVKLDVDRNPSVIEKFQIEAIPTLIVFQDGEGKGAHHRRGESGRDRPRDRCARRQRHQIGG